MALTLHGTVSDNTVALDRKTATPLIINGDMAIWQRGTSHSSGYTADRWEIAGSSMTASRSTDVPNDTFKYSYSFVGSSQAHVKQKIEAQNIYHVKGQDITISFYLKQTVGAGTDKVGVVLYTPTAEDNYSGVTEIASQNITTTSSWARYVVTFTNIASSVTNGLQPLLFFTSTDSQTMLFTGFQLEVGNFDSNSIPPFQFEDRGTSLARCQRYYQKSYQQSDAPATATQLGSIWHEVGDSTTDFLSFSYNTQIEMRSSPTIVTYDLLGTSAKVSYSGSTNGKTGTVANASPKGWRVYTDNSTSKDALVYQFTASAEL